jgi:hypothetical protein
MNRITIVDHIKIKHMKKWLFALMMVFTINTIAQDAKMKTFVDGLMKKMTLDERSGN